MNTTQTILLFVVSIVFGSIYIFVWLAYKQLLDSEGLNHGDVS